MNEKTLFSTLPSQALHLRQALELLWQENPRRTLASALLHALEGLWPTAVIFLIRDLVDALAAFLAGPRGLPAAKEPLRVVVILVAVMAAGEILRSLNRWLRQLQAEHLRQHIEGRIQEQAIRMDLSFYERADYYDMLHRARHEASFRPALLLDHLASLLENSVTFLSMGVILIQLGSWLPALLLASTLPALFVVAHFSWEQHAWKKESTPEERRGWYYDWLLTSGEAAPEVRVFGLGPHFRSLYNKLSRELVRRKLHLLGKQSVAEILAAGFAWLVLGLSLFWMLTRVLDRQTTLGNLALFYQAFSQGQLLLRSLLGNLGQIYASSLFLGNLFEFLSLQPLNRDTPGIQASPAPLREGVRFQQVGFAYPNSSKPVFENLDLWIPADKLTAIVGPNGAGKSTLLKLLSRLYEPGSGEIFWDKVPLHGFSRDALLTRISVLFQDPLRYNGLVRENIGLGELLRTQEAADVLEAASAAGVDEIASRLPQGYETLLGTWFAGGTELSHGEWQRLALARAYFRRASLLLLDEPTSFMDPWAEIEWMSRFRGFLKGRTAVLITHRLTTASRADLIYVFEGGKIVESGTHTDLLEKRGLYWSSWQSQARS